MKNKSKKIGQKFEEKVQKTINSGALTFDKGDLKTDNYLIECKATEKKSYSINIKTLRKIWDEALERNKLPRLVIGIKDENHQWVLNVDINKERI